MPELGLDQTTIRSTCWLARRGARVIEGDRLLEVVAGDVAYDVAAPCSGILVRKCVGEDQVLEVGQVLGEIDARPLDDLL
jgi:pyruvate/2-oxoglutarate dehydrogenase complex dihydrolipoamide acyltransferase (E2) component